MTKKHIRLISILITSAAVLLYSAYNKLVTSPQQNSAASVKVTEVHDGDTFNVMLNSKKERIRLIGIDTPELGQKPWGKKAKKHLEEILDSAGWEVILEFDADERDKYGRFLCYAKTANNTFINLKMIKDGYAMLLTIPPNIKYVDELRQAQTEARELKLGIWGSEGLKEVPSEYRKKHKN
jgi:micrococcal nuclease